jgi:hypothetical protein
MANHEQDWNAETFGSSSLFFLWRVPRMSSCRSALRKPGWPRLLSILRVSLETEHSPGF